MFHDAVNLIPTQPQLFGDRLLASVFQPRNGQPFHQGGKARVGLGPRQLYHAHPVLTTLTARRCGMQNGAVLTGIQMPPLPLGLMIVESTTGSAFGTGPLAFVFMGQIDVHLALLQLEFHALDSPRRRDAPNTAVQFPILRSKTFPRGGASRPSAGPATAPSALPSSTAVTP